MSQIWRRDADIERNSRARSRSTVITPLIVFTKSGKKVSVAATSTFGVRPKPNQMTNSGASATFGSDWNATR